MKLFNRSKDKKINKSDIAIIILSLVSLVLLVLIVVISKHNEKTIVEELTSNSLIEQAEEHEQTEDVQISNTIIISEISSDGYIELYNDEYDSFDLSGYQVVYKGNQILTIEDGTKIAKNSYYAIETGSKLGENGNEILDIKSGEGISLCSIMVPKIESGLSYGLVDVKGYDMEYMPQTKGSQNQKVDSGDYAVIDGIGFSVPGGFYDSEFKLSMTCSDGLTIYYTMDGTEPTTESTIYSEPVSIKNMSGSNYEYAKEAIGYSGGVYTPGTVDRGVVLRAIAVDSNGNVKSSSSQSYFVGFKKDSRYLNIPVISLTVNPEDMFDYFDGIYVSGRTKEDDIAQGGNGESKANYYNGWEKNAEIEFYEAGKANTLRDDVTVKINIDFAVADRQKGLIFSIKDYNADDYAGSSIHKFFTSDGKLTLTQNYSDNDTKIRDYLINELMEDSSVGTAELMPVILFIDGEYWGLYMLQAPYDEAYISRNYGIDDQRVDIHTYNTFNQAFYDFNAFVVNNDMSLAENYEQVKTMMDVDSYLEYVCMNMFVSNSYFNSLRTTQWKTTETTGTGYNDGRWRWLMSRMDNTLFNASTQSDTIDSFLQNGFTHDAFIQSLLMNQEFCNSLYSKMETMVKERLITERAESILSDLQKLMERPTVASRTRFYGTAADLYSTDVDKIIYFFENRKDYIMVYTKETADAGGDLSFLAEENITDQMETFEDTDEGN